MNGGTELYVANGGNFPTGPFGLPYPVNDGKWHLFDVERDGGCSVSLDGALVGSSSSCNQVDGLSGFTLGNWSGGGTAGSFDEVAVYPYELRGDEVSTHALVGGPQIALIGGAVSAQELFGGGGFCLPCLMKSTIHTIFGAPVDTEDGNMYHTFNDLEIPGRGIPLAFTRTYNSMAADTNGSHLGYGWVDNLGASLTLPSTVSTGSTATLTEENGAQTTFTYNGTAWAAPPRDIATLTDNSGTWTVVRQAQQTLRFNSSGQLMSMKDLNGYMTSYTYNSKGRLANVTDSAGRSLKLAYTGGLITTVTDANVSPARVVHFTYNSAGDLTDVIDVDGGHTHYVYNKSHEMTAMLDPKCYATSGCPGIVTHYKAGQVTSQTDQLGRKTTFLYAGDPAAATGGTTTITDPMGNETLDTYEYGVLVSETRGYGTAQAATTTYRYDPATGQPILVVDPDGNATSMTYDSSGNMLTETDALGRETKWTYNSLNEPATVTDPTGVTTTNTYDSDGNLTQVSTPCPDCTPAATQTTIYTVCESTTCTVGANTYQQGDVESMTDPDTNVWTYGYDKYGYRTQTTDPLGNETTATFNADGWPLTTVSPKGNVAGCNCATKFTTTDSYIIPGTSKTDEFGDVQTVKDPLGHITTTGYDADRNQTSVKDANGNLTTYVYDLANEQTEVIRPGKPHTKLITDYNRDGTVADQKDGKGNAIQTYGYDSLARVTTVKDALGNVTTYTYDPAGNRLTQQNPGGSCLPTPTVGCTTYTYDAANQLTSVSYTDTPSENVTNITYDADGQRTSMTDNTGTWIWTYDSLHRLTSVTEGNNGTTSYQYNLRNLPTQITYPNSTNSVTNGYDNAGRWNSVTDWNGNETMFGYDPNSNLTSESLPTTAQVLDTYKYNAADQMTSIKDKNATTTVFTATYGRDNNGQLTTDSSQPTNVNSYGYTALNQVCYAGSTNTAACTSPPAQSQPFTYDAADNLVQDGTTTQAFNAGDELCWTAPSPSTNACNSTPTGGTTYSYNTQGDRTATVPSTGAATCDLYDQANRLTTIETGTGSSCTSPTTVGSYTYNANGLRMSKTVGSTTTSFAWDLSGSLPLLLQESTSSASTSYVYGPGGLPLEQITSAGVTSWYQHDQLGSTRVILNGSGATEATYTYDPYGNITACAGTTVTVGGLNICSGVTTVTNPLDYAGQYRDDESNLYYLGVRYYDPVTAQFLTVDPAVESTMSPYAYVAGNPLNRTDPSGKISFDQMVRSDGIQGAVQMMQQFIQQCSQWGSGMGMCMAAAMCGSAQECHDIAQQDADLNGVAEQIASRARCSGSTTIFGATITEDQAQTAVRQTGAAFQVAAGQINWQNQNASCQAFAASAGVILVGSLGAAGAAVGGGIAAGGALDIAEGVHLGGFAAAGGAVGGTGAMNLVQQNCGP